MPTLSSIRRCTFSQVSVALRDVETHQHPIWLENTMPLWQVYHPVGAYSAQDKKDFAEKVTAMYARIPIPNFYVVMIFDEVAAEQVYVGGVSHSGRPVDRALREGPGI
jgi:phenylpyruvate tautomerase PptA (4-oxalocrotonate tautomerase family)